MDSLLAYNYGFDNQFHGLQPVYIIASISAEHDRKREREWERKQRHFLWTRVLMSDFVPLQNSTGRVI